MATNLDIMRDEALFQRFISMRDQKAFEVLYRRHYTSLAKYIGWLAFNIEIGKDVAQNTFVKLFHGGYLFDERRNFKTWLFVIAKNQWLNERRREIRYVDETDASTAKVIDNFENGDEYDEKLKKLQKSLKKLSEQHRETFVLKYSDNLTISEISDVCNCSEGTVKSRLFYSMQQLKKLIDQEK